MLKKSCRNMGREKKWYFREGHPSDRSGGANTEAYQKLIPSKLYNQESMGNQEDWLRIMNFGVLSL